MCLAFATATIPMQPHMSIQKITHSLSQPTHLYRQNSLSLLADGKISETLNLNEKCKLRILNCCCCFFFLFCVANVLKHAESWVSVDERSEMKLDFFSFSSSAFLSFLPFYLQADTRTKRRKKSRELYGISTNTRVICKYNITAAIKKKSWKRKASLMTKNNI